MAFSESVASAWSSRSASPLEAATASTKAPPRPPPDDATTAAPWSRAMSAVASVEPPSATITSSVAPSHAETALRTLAMHRPMQPASFRAAMQTERQAKPAAWCAIVPRGAAHVCTGARPVQRRGIENYTCIYRRSSTYWAALAFIVALDVLGCLGRRLALTTAAGPSPPPLARPTTSL